MSKFPKCLLKLMSFPSLELDIIYPFLEKDERKKKNLKKIKKFCSDVEVPECLLKLKIF